MLSFAQLIPKEIEFSIFKSLYGAEDIVSLIASYDNFDNQIILRDEVKQEFIVMKSVDFAKIKTNFPTFIHEVIPPNAIQRIRFDIDAKPQSCAKSDIKRVIDAIINNTIALFESDIACNQCHPEPIWLDDFHIFSSTSEQKYSFHILTPIWVANSDLAKYFSDLIIDKISLLGLPDIIDRGVNKPWQNFRMPLSAKSSDPSRVKRLINASGKIIEITNYMNMLIRWYGEGNPPIMIFGREHDCGATEPTPIGTNFELDIVSANPELHTAIEEMLQVAIPDFNKCWLLRNEINGLFSFTRLAPSHCTLCNEVHHKDNNLYVTVGPSATKPIYMHCRHNAAKIKIGNFGKSDAISQPIPEPRILQDDIELEKFIESKKISKIIYCENSIRQYPIVETLFVKAPMGIGKTQELIKHIDRLIARQPKTEQTLIYYVSFRQTFSSAIIRELNTNLVGAKFVNYMDVAQYKIDPNSIPQLVIQIESLRRIVITATQPFILVLDEIESILSQFMSHHIQDLNQSYGIFEWLIRYSKYCICMDANLNVRSLRYISKFREPSKMLYIENTFQNAIGTTAYLAKTVTDLIEVMRNKLALGKKIVVATNSISEARIIQQGLKYYFKLIDICDDAAIESHDGKTIAIYSSETSPTIKQKHYNDVATYWSKLDILIFTPSVSAGISYTEHHFDSLFAYMTDKSCNVETSLQMLRRVRNLDSNEYYICIKSSHEVFPTNPQQVEQQLLALRLKPSQIIGGQYRIDMPADVTYSETGQHIYKKLSFFDLYVENICFDNKSKNNFFERFIIYLRKQGINIKLLAIDGAADVGAVDQSPVPARPTLKKEAEEERAKQILEANKLTDEQFKMIGDIIRSSGKLSDITILNSDMLSYRKTLLGKWYCIDVDEIEPQHVVFLDNKSNMSCFRYLHDIRDIFRIPIDSDDFKSKLRKILLQLEQTDHSARNLAIQYNDKIKDLTVEDRHSKHLHAIKFIEILGFQKIISDDSQISEDKMEQNFSKLNLTQQNANLLAALYGISQITVGKQKEEISFINKILKQLYLMEIKYTKKSNSYKLQYNMYLTTIVEQAPVDIRSQFKIANNIGKINLDIVDDY